MKTRSLVLLLVVVCSSHAVAQFSIVHHFDDELSNPRSTGIFEGVVYGFADLDFNVADEPISNLFSFGLDGTNVQARNIHSEVGGYALDEIGRGPLTIRDGVIYGTTDLGDTFTATTTNLVATPRANWNTNWVNPVVVNNAVVVGAGGSSYGVGVDPLNGMPDSVVTFADSPVQATTTDGSNIFASTLGRVSDFEGSVVSIASDGIVTTLRIHYDDIFSLAYSEGRLYGFGDEGLFGINTDGTGFELLKDDVVGTRIIVEGDTIYGVATPTYDNPGESEALFRIDTDGSDFEVLHEFGAGPDNGIGANPDLLIVGSTLHGSTYSGGENDQGTYYSFELDGSTSPNAVPEPTSVVAWLALMACGCVWHRVRMRS